MADVLAGMRLPHGLVPLGHLTARPMTGDRMAVWTDEAPSPAVAAAMADELRRLGFTLEALDEMTVLGTRAGERIMVVVHPVGAAATLDGVKLFPTVPDEMAPVVELWVVPA